MARSGSSIIVRVLLWIVFVLAAAVVSFFIGFLVGPYLIDRFLG
jgi:hypothetical protein